MKDSIEMAKRVLLEDTEVLYGIFGVIESSGYYPPLEFLNEFLIVGSDPCDQDGRMDKWIHFRLELEAFQQVFNWWKNYIQVQLLMIWMQKIGLIAYK